MMRYITSISRTTSRCALASKRRFSTTTTLRLGKDETDRKHATDKSDTLDVQSEAVARGKSSREAGGPQNNATSEKDLNRSNKRAKEEHPKAPEPVIGMNDERGTKGH
ncbi:hypothetical protein L228DRAFT_246487 [Xylona heveae TC161]|uniref:Uncharacterized protein n=1 Tax=Xylona heveae (strain CBS 132557 / TC161) TaxID=1328760 RepID=A0A165HKM3_XYLHT|nr:hypothetical protein L228DRAFT_246487 [Xylona heveae TC161]KZF23654.1 hypothetical protein L228DRAFT_246487 [Xylona heveae TC161]